MTLKEKDFIEVEYTGRLKGDDLVFDTTDEKTAKDAGIHSPQTTYGPVIVCLGQGHLLRGLEKGLIGKDLGEYKIEVSPEDGFGKKSAKLIQLIPTRKFTGQEIMPQVGLQVEVDGQMGIIKTVSGGRTLVDFNHPLSGKELTYDIKAIKVVTDPVQKLKAALKVQLAVKEPDVEVKGKDAIVYLELPGEIAKPLGDSFKEMVGLDSVEFKKKEKKSIEKKVDKKVEVEKKDSVPASGEKEQ